MIKRVFSGFIVLVTTLALAEGTRVWKESGYEDFERGTAKGVAISSKGSLGLAPAFKVVYTSPSTFIWSIAADKDGKVYKITRKAGPGSATEFTAAVFFDPKTKYIWDMEFDPQGRLYLATGDRGEIYRVDQSGQGAV